MYRLAIFDLDGTLADLSGWPYIGADMYPDMRDAVGILRENGVVLALATLMDGDSAESVLRGWGVRESFSCVMGRSSTYDKGALIRGCLEFLGCSPADALMIGDSPGDLRGARSCGVDFVGAPRSDFDAASDGIYVPMDGYALCRFVFGRNRCAQLNTGRMIGAHVLGCVRTG